MLGASTDVSDYELVGRIVMQNDEMKKEEIVVPMRFELMTFRLSAGRSNRAKLWDQQV